MCIVCCGEFVEEFQLASFGSTKCGATHLESSNFACKNHTCHLCKLCGDRWLKSLPVIGNPLAAVGCWLEGAALYVGRVPSTARNQQGLCNHVGYMSCDCEIACVKRSCQEAFALQGQSVLL